MACLMLAACSTGPPAPTPTEAGMPPLFFDESEVDAWRDHVDPARDEERDLPWLPRIADGMRDAYHEDRPLFAWIGIQHPLLCACPGDLIGDAASLDDPSLRALLAEYTLAAGSRREVETSTHPWVRRFRDASRQQDGPYAGQVASGFYAVTPSGRLLARASTFHVDDLMTTVSSGLERWFELSADDRLGPRASDADPRGPKLASDGGVALTVTGRPLPISGDPTGQRYPSFSRDELWLLPDDAGELTPSPPTVGAVDDGATLAQKLAAWYLIDPINPTPFATDEVAEATLTSRVVAVSAGSVTLSISGTTWAIDASASRAVQSILRGEVELSQGTHRPLRVELTAKGQVRTGDHIRPVGWVVRASPSWRAYRCSPSFDPRYADRHEHAP